MNVEGRPSRRVISVTEVVGLDTKTNEFITNEAYKYDPEGDSFVFTGRSYILEKLARSKGVPVEELTREVATRKTVLQWMVDNNVKVYKDVAKIVQRYYTDRAQLLAEIGAIAA
jgi:flagellar protein FlaI